MTKSKRLWCEFFDKHEWFTQETFFKEGVFWEVNVCKKCGKIKIEPGPIFEIPHIELVSND